MGPSPRFYLYAAQALGLHLRISIEPTRANREDGLRHCADQWWCRTVCRAFPRSESRMQFVIVERFRGGDPVPVYRRFRDRGRLAPEGLRYINSWVSRDLTTCYQVMECDDRRLLDQWIANWSDIVEFEVIPALTSAEAAAAVAPRL